MKKCIIIILTLFIFAIYLNAENLKKKADQYFKKRNYWKASEIYEKISGNKPKRIF